MAKLYTRVNWAGFPSKDTPISAANLNKMDKGIDDLDNKAESIASDVSDLSDAVDGIEDKINTFLEGTLTAGQTSLTINDSSITTTKLFDIYTSIYGENPLTVSVSTGKIVMTFRSISSNLKVYVRVVTPSS